MPGPFCVSECILEVGSATNTLHSSALIEVTTVTLTKFAFH